MSADHFHVILAYALSCRMLRAQSLHALPELFLKAGHINCDIEIVPSWEKCYSEQSCQIAHQAVVGHLGQKRWELGTLVGSILLCRMNFMEQQLNLMKVRFSCPSGFMSTCKFVNSKHYRDSALPVSWPVFSSHLRKCSAVITFTECCYYLTWI